MTAPLTAAEALGQEAPIAPAFELIVERNRTYAEGRRCCEPGCITILCRFNSGPECYAHQDERLAREAERAAEARRRAA